MRYVKLAFKRVAIIGVGLIGGSLGLSLRRHGLTGEVVGCGRSHVNLQDAVRVGAIDHFEMDPAAAADGADLVVLGVPVGGMPAVMQQIAPHLERHCLVTDVGSTKHGIALAARQAFGEALPRFVPGHPIAGTERQGAAAAMEDLFEGRRVILTPLAETDATALQRVRGLWEALGAVVTEMDTHHHDEVLAATSHLPHVLAYALVDQLAGMQEKREIFEYAAGGFRDFTRIASSSPEMWRDIVHANRDALLPVLDAFRSSLAVLRDAIEKDDEETLMQCFTRAKTTRDRLIRLADPEDAANPDLPDP